jgi:cytochrome c biogenesis protein CcmG/thiol:disulfide interchange protein DsbE
VGKPAADFARETLKGDTVKLADLGNQPLVINFWASWCIPCEAEHPILIDFSRRYQGKIRLIGILYEDTKANGLRWFQEKGGDWTTLLDPRGKMAIEYGVRGVPETFFITRDHHILYHHPAPVTGDVLEVWSSRLLASDSARALKASR